MGTVRSVIDVPVQTAAFEKFVQLFDAYSENLRKQPEIWKKINAEHSKLATGFAQLGNKMEAHFTGIQELQNAQEANEKSLMHSDSLWSGIEKSSGKTAKNVLSATTSLLKWTGLLSGVTGVLGYLTLGGIMGLGSDVFGWRKSAMGLGITTGQQRAFDIAFGRLLGSPQGFLGGISGAVSNIASPGYAMLNALGVNPNGSTSGIAVSTLEAIRALALRTPLNQLGITEQMYHLGEFGIGIEDLRRLKAMSGGEFGQLLGTYRTQQNALNLGGPATKAWTDFLTKMDLAKGKIENVFVTGLERLNGPLADVANSFAHMLTVMVNSKDAQNGLRTISQWMERFSGNISKPQFLANVEKFGAVFDDIVDRINDVGRIWGAAKVAVGEQTEPIVSGGVIVGTTLADWWGRLSPYLSLHGGANYAIAERLKWTAAANKMDPSGVLGLVGWLESGMNPNIADSDRGAEGLMQIMPKNAKAAGIDPYNPRQALNWANQQLEHLYREYRGNILKMLAAYNAGEGTLNADIAAHGAQWQRYLPPETQAYLVRAIKAILSGAIKVDITNATGAQVAQSVSGLGASR